MAHSTREVRDRGIDGDHEIELSDEERGVSEIRDWRTRPYWQSRFGGGAGSPELEGEPVDTGNCE